MLPYQTIYYAYTLHEQILKIHRKTINFKHQYQHGMKNLNYQMDHILHQIFNISLSILSKNMKH